MLACEGGVLRFRDGYPFVCFAVQDWLCSNLTVSHQYTVRVLETVILQLPWQ